MSDAVRTDTPPPPYQTMAEGFGVQLVYDEAVVRRMLPPGIEPADGMTGGLNLYTADLGYGLTPYTAVYFYLHVKGLDSADGAHARWMLQGVYGPDPRVPAALHRHYGMPVRVGESRLDARADCTVGTGTLAGRDMVRIEVRTRPATFAPTAGIVHFGGRLERTGEIVVMQMPFLGEVCELEPVSFEVLAPPGDPMNLLKSVQLGGGGFGFKHFTFAFPTPVAARDLVARRSPG